MWIDRLKAGRGKFLFHLFSRAHLRDSLFVLSSVKGGPGYPTRILSLKEERFGFAILKAEDLAIASNVELSLQLKPTVSGL